MSLGDKLQATITELDDAKVSHQGADLPEIRRRKQARAEWGSSIYTQIVDSIENDKVPLIKVTNRTDQNWIKAAVIGKAEFQDTWNLLLSMLGKEKLILVTGKDHDGGGITDWTTIKVKPSTTKVNYRGSDTSPTTSYGKPY
tara:strand:- start:2305 stop:2730 length:426 start_codon:yes stop_codon:yes gene_type:complete